MATKVTQKSEIVIENNNVEEALKPHIDKLIKTVKFFDSQYIVMTTHVEQMSDRTINAYVSIKVDKIMKKKQ